jgi:flagellar motor switch protein FliN/FliY
MDNFLSKFSKIVSDNFKNILQTLTSENISINIISKGLATISDFSEEFKKESIVTVFESINNIKGGIFFYKKDLIGISNLMLTGEFTQEDVFTDEKMDAVMEFFRQLLSSINVPFSEQFGKKVNFQVHEILEVDDGLIKSYGKQYDVISFDVQLGQETVNAVFFLDSYLEKIFQDNEKDTDKIQNIDLLLDIVVPVSVIIGTTKIFLKDLLNLTSGNVIELDQSVNEPVELTVNNKTIAYGEVVVADGYFGLKIKEIINKTERIKRLSDREV